VVLPILGIGAAVIEDAGNLAEDLEESEAINTTQIEQRLAEYTGQNFDIETSLDSFVSTFHQYSRRIFSDSHYFNRDCNRRYFANIFTLLSPKRWRKICKMA